MRFKTIKRAEALLFRARLLFFVFWRLYNRIIIVFLVFVISAKILFIAVLAEKIRYTGLYNRAVPGHYYSLLLLHTERYCKQTSVRP